MSWADEIYESMLGNLVKMAQDRSVEKHAGEDDPWEVYLTGQLNGRILEYVRSMTGEDDTEMEAPMANVTRVDWKDEATASAYVRVDGGTSMDPNVYYKAVESAFRDVQQAMAGRQKALSWGKIDLKGAPDKQVGQARQRPEPPPVPQDCNDARSGKKCREKWSPVWRHYGFLSDIDLTDDDQAWEDED